MGDPVTLSDEQMAVLVAKLSEQLAPVLSHGGGLESSQSGTVLGNWRTRVMGGKEEGSPLSARAGHCACRTVPRETAGEGKGEGEGKGGG